jgi:multiple sugar transport system substrate-binding protein
VFVAYSHQLGDLVAEGRLLPIPTAYPLTTTIASNLVSGIQAGGQNYCFPRDVALLALFYNPAVFDRVGAPYPQSNWSWTELRSALEATTDVNNGFHGLVLDYDLSRFFPFLRQSSSDGDLWQGPDAAAALEYFMALYNDQLAVVPGYLDSGWNGEAFGRGRAAMTIEGNWLVGYLANEFPGLDYGIVPLPSGPAGRGAAAFISCWVVNAAADDPAAALALAAFLTSQSQIAAWADASGNLPPFPDQATAWVGRHPEYEPFVASLAYAAPWSGPAGFIDQSESVNLGMQMWYNDEMTTPELIARLAEMSAPSLLPQPTATPSD